MLLRLRCTFRRQALYRTKTQNLAHVKGSTDHKISKALLGDLLDQRLQNPSAPLALVSLHEDIRWTYEELRHQANKFASGLIKFGYKKGDRLGAWLPNCKDYLVAQFACGRIGVVLVTINPAYRSNEVEFALQLVGCKGLLITPKIRSSDYSDLLTKIGFIPRGSGVFFPTIPSLEHIFYTSFGTDDKPEEFPGFTPISALYTSPQDLELEKIRKTLHCDDPINVQFTSGTTGPPKAAVLTHSNIINNGISIGDRLNYSPKDKVCIPVPLYHCFGLVIGNLAAITHGSTIVYPSPNFDAEKVLEAIDKEQITSCNGVPTMFISMLHHPNFKKYSVDSLRTGVMAGSSCPESLMKQMITDLHMKEITICYGMTETSPVSFQSLRDADVISRCTSVGVLLPNVEAKVVNPANSDEVLNFGEAGELMIKGYNVMKGYFKNGEKNDGIVPANLNTKIINDDGWIQTGDLFVIEENGTGRVVGRIKDLIIRGGENIYPREIEEALFHHPDIKLVSVVGVKDDFLGEAVCACVVPKKDGFVVSHDSVEKLLADRFARYKIPKHVITMEEKDVPMTITGKIQNIFLRIGQPNT